MFCAAARSPKARSWPIFPRALSLGMFFSVESAKSYSAGNEKKIAMYEDVADVQGSIKVIGFHDAKWQCKLYTQTLVDRSHYTTFNGHYFPLELRNWYSDNWITSVYTDQGKCNTNAKISNGNIDTRYENCSDREYRRLVSWENKLNE